VLAEGEKRDHQESIEAARRAAQVHPEYSSLKRIVPAAAAIAVATLNAAHPVLSRDPEGPVPHKDVTALAEAPKGDGGHNAA
jgi:stearoyl-CoA desaturase (delta-9 desaturase)